MKARPEQKKGDPGRREGKSMKNRQSSEEQDSLFEGVSEQMFLTNNPQRREKPDFSTRMSKLYSKKKKRLQRKRAKQKSGHSRTDLAIQSSSDLAYASGPMKLEGDRRRESLALQNIYLTAEASERGGAQTQRGRRFRDSPEQRGRPRGRKRSVSSKRGSKSPLTNLAPGSQYQKLLKKKKRKRPRGSRSRDLVGEDDAELQGRLIEGLEQISEKNRTLEISSRFGSMRVGPKGMMQGDSGMKPHSKREYEKSLMELEGLMGKKQSRRYMPKKKEQTIGHSSVKEVEYIKAPGEEAQFDKKAKEWIKSGDPRLRALGRNIRAAKTYKKHYMEMASKEVKKGVNESKSFINLYRKKSKKRRKKKKGDVPEQEEDSKISNFDEKFIQALEDERTEEVSMEMTKEDNHISGESVKEEEQSVNEDPMDEGEGEHASVISLKGPSEPPSKMDNQVPMPQEKEASERQVEPTKEESEKRSDLNEPVSKKEVGSEVTPKLETGKSEVNLIVSVDQGEAKSGQMKSKRSHKKPTKPKKNFFEINKQRLAEKQRRIKQAKEEKKRREELARQKEQKKNRSTNLVNSRVKGSGLSRRRSMGSQTQKDSVLSQSRLPDESRELALPPEEVKEVSRSPPKNAFLESKLIQNQMRHEPSMEKINQVLRELSQLRQEGDFEVDRGKDTEQEFVTPNRYLVKNHDDQGDSRPSPLRRSASGQIPSSPKRSARKNSSASRDGYYHRAVISREQSKKSFQKIKRENQKIERVIRKSQPRQVNQSLSRSVSRNASTRGKQSVPRPDPKSTTPKREPKEKKPLKTQKPEETAKPESIPEKNEPKKVQKEEKSRPESTKVEPTPESTQKTPKKRESESGYSDGPGNLEKDLIGDSRVLDNSQVKETFEVDHSQLSNTYQNPFSPAPKHPTQISTVPEVNSQLLSQVKEGKAGRSPFRKKKTASQDQVVSKTPQKKAFSKKNKKKTAVQVVEKKEEIITPKKPVIPQFKKHSKKSETPREPKPESTHEDAPTSPKKAQPEPEPKRVVSKPKQSQKEEENIQIKESNFMSVNYNSLDRKTGGDVDACEWTLRNYTSHRVTKPKPEDLIESQVVKKSTDPESFGLGTFGKGTELLMPKPKARRPVRKEAPKKNFLELNKQRITEKPKEAQGGRLRSSHSVGVHKKGLFKNKFGGFNRPMHRDASVHIQKNIKSLRNNLPLSRKFDKFTRPQKKGFRSSRNVKMEAKRRRLKEVEDERMRELERKKKKEEEFRSLKKKFEKKFFDKNKSGRDLQTVSRSSRRVSRREIPKRDTSQGKSEKEQSVISMKSGLGTDQQILSLISPGRDREPPKKKETSNPAKAKINFIERNKELMRQKAEKLKKEQEEKKRQEEVRKSRFFGVSKFEKKVESKIDTGSVDKKRESLKKEAPGQASEEGQSKPEIQEEEEPEVKLQEEEKPEEEIEEEEVENDPPAETKEEVPEEKKEESLPEAVEPLEPTKLEEVQPIVLQEKKKKPKKSKHKRKNSEPLIEQKPGRGGLAKSSFKVEQFSKTMKGGFMNKSEAPSQSRREALGGWNSSVKLNKQVFKKRKEYVNPMAFKPKPKAPTKEVDIDDLKRKARENQIKKKNEERKRAIQATLPEGMSDFVILEKVIPIEQVEKEEPVQEEGLPKEEPAPKKSRIQSIREEIQDLKKMILREDELEPKPDKPEKKEVPKREEKPKEPSVEKIRNKFGRKDHRMWLRMVTIQSFEWKEEEETEVPEVPEVAEVPKEPEPPKPVKAKDNDALVTRLMEKYSIKEEKKKPKAESVQREEPAAPEEKEESGLVPPKMPKIDELKQKLELMKERLSDNRAQLKQEIEVEAQKTLSKSKVRNMDKYLRKGSRKRERLGSGPSYDYPVYRPKPGQGTRSRKGDAGSRVSNKVEEAPLPEKPVEEEKEESTPKEEVHAEKDEIREMCRNIIKEKIEEDQGAKPETGEKKEETVQEEKEESTQKEEEQTQKETPTPKEEKEEPVPVKTRSKSKPKKKLKSKRDMRPRKDGYLSKYASKLREGSNEKKPKKLPRFSSRARKKKKPSLVDNFASDPSALLFDSNLRKPPAKKEKKKDADPHAFGTRTLESIPSLGFAGNDSKDFSMTLTQSQFKGEAQKRGAQAKKQTRGGRVKRKRKRSASTGKKAKNVRKGRRDSPRGSKRKKLTSMEEVERTPPRIEQESQEVISRSQAPKKLKSFEDSASKPSTRDYSLGPKPVGNFGTRNINKKTLRPLIKKESLERMSMSISKNRVFPKSKSKQQLLNNLEKLKKFKPLIKHSIDTFEKPRKSLLQRMELHGEESGEDEYEVIAEEGQSNYNTRNSYDDFLEIEKNIRKSVRIDHLKGVGKKAKRMKTNDDQYVDEIVEMTIGLPVDPKASKKKRPKKPKPKTASKLKRRKTKRQIFEEADNLAVDLEANLLKLKEEMENEEELADRVSVSGDESVPISSMKGGFVMEGSEYPEYTPDTSMRKAQKFDRTKSMVAKSKALSRTLDVIATNEVKTIGRQVEKQESLRDIIANNKMSLKWRKERIKEYGRVKKKPRKKGGDRDTHPSPKGRKGEIRKLNSKFGKEPKSGSRTPKERGRVTGEYGSCVVQFDREKGQSRDSYEWLIENEAPGKGRFDSDTTPPDAGRQFKMATGDQNVTLGKAPKKDRHFEQLLKKNANPQTMNQSNPDEVSRPESRGGGFPSETSIRMRRKNMRKTDLKKKLDLDRLKNLSSKMQKRSSVLQSQVDGEEPQSKSKSKGKAHLLKDLHSKFQGGGRRAQTDRPVKIISELGSGNDLMVKNRLIQGDGDGARTPRNPKKEQYRRDRIKEYGQKLKSLGSKDRLTKKRRVDPKEFLENL